MTLSPVLRLVRRCRNYHSSAFQSPLLIQIFTSVVFPPRSLRIGMHLQTLLSPLLKVPRMELLNSLLWWELGTNLPGPGPGVWMSFWHVTSNNSDSDSDFPLGLNPSKALGPDELCPRALKELATELGPVFAHLFQQQSTLVKSQGNGLLQIFAPLKSDRSLAGNYRPVSLTCVPCKLLEHIVCSNIMAHLDEYNLLSDRQHAFRKGHSCETQLTTVINHSRETKSVTAIICVHVTCKFDSLDRTKTRKISGAI